MILRYPLSLAAALSVGLVIGAGLGRERVEAEPLVNLSTGDQSFTILHWDGGAVGMVSGENSGPVKLLPHETPPPAVPSVFRLAKVTAYDAGCEVCCPGCDGITSTGRDVRHYRRGVAVDPRLVPYGTHLVIPGYGEAVADDTGSALRRSGRRGIMQLDIRLRSHEAAERWGVRWLQVEVRNVAP